MLDFFAYLCHAWPLWYKWYFLIAWMNIWFEKWDTLRRSTSPYQHLITSTLIKHGILYLFWYWKNDEDDMSYCNWMLFVTHQIISINIRYFCMRRKQLMSILRWFHLPNGFLYIFFIYLFILYNNLMCTYIVLQTCNVSSFTLCDFFLIWNQEWQICGNYKTS